MKPEETKQCSGGPIGFSQLESGAASKVQRQVSFRMQRKNILRKTLTSDKWRGAARKVKVRRFGVLKIYNLAIRMILIYKQKINWTIFKKSTTT